MDKFGGVHEVLDVAGGKGDLAFELGARRNIKCSVVDPRDPGKFQSKSVQRWQRKILASKPDFDYVHHRTEFDRDFCQTHLASSSNSAAVVIVGMHPDQATEAIVDLSLEFSRPFAVVPCCVFAHMFPDRRLRTTGEEPKTYEEFCQYLREKDPRIQQESLGFKGRNTVLHWKPYSEPAT